MFYIEKDNKIVLFNEDKQKIIDTLIFTPQYQNLEIQETDRPIVDFQFADTEEYKQEQVKKENEQNDKLHITKLDFFTYICEPANITYSDLIAKIKELNMEAQWELCNHVYYGIIKPFLTTLDLQKTEQEIINIFKEHNTN